MNRISKSLLYLIFFVSGASALTFETLWFRQAGLVLGNSVWASSMVLAAFMAGLALGNWGAGRFGDRFRRPILVYGVFELLIGGTGLLLVWLLPQFNETLHPVFQRVSHVPWILNGIRLGIAFLLMLIPTAAMGATLPLMVKGLRGQSETFGQTLGALYACNTLGAMVGALVCEFVLIGAFGLRGSGVCAAAMNGVAALVAIAVTARWKAVTPVAEIVNVRRRLSSRARRLLAGAFLAGGTLLALEVIWFRHLVLFSYGTSAVFAVMLAVVLAGIGVGGIIAARLSRKARAADVLPGVVVSAGLLAVLSYAVPSVLFVMFPVSRSIDSFTLAAAVHAIPVILPVCVASGMIFTLMGDALRGESDSDTAAAGYLTLANTTGAMCGAIVGGFVLLPILGIEWSVFVLSGVYLVAAMLCLPALEHFAVWSRRVALAGGVALAGLLVMFPHGMVSKLVFMNIARGYTKGDTRVVEIKEGLIDTLMYTQTEWLGQPLYQRLITNSHSMSSTDIRCWQYMKMYVYLPVAIHPAPRKSCLISYGCGVTAKALTDCSEFTQIDFVDISRDILDMNSVVFPDPDDLPLNDPRVRVFVEDGRFFLQSSDERYDLITSEPPPPKAASVVSLYTREYFQLIHDRLAPGGMTTYWLPQHDLSEGDSRAIVRAFVDVFDESSLWLGSGGDWMLLGVRDGGERVSPEHFRKQWSDAKVAGTLAACGFETPEQFGSYFIGDADLLRELTAETPPLLDDFPHRLSPSFVNLQLDSRYAEMLDADASRQRFLDSDHIRRLWPEELIDPTLPYFDQRLLIHDVMAERQNRVESERIGRLESLHELLTQSPLKTPVLWHLGSTHHDQRVVDQVQGEMPDEPGVLLRLGHRMLSERDFVAAGNRYAQTLDALPDELPVLYQTTALRRAYALCMQGARQQAEDEISELIAKTQLTPEHERDWEFLQSEFGLGGENAGRAAAAVLAEPQGVASSD